MGELVPIGLTEVLPGDTFQHATSLLLRVSPLLAPVMHPVPVRIHHWFVPFRLIWEDFEDFITGGPDGMDASVFPTVNMTFTAGTPNTGNNQVGMLPDYLGVPPEINNLAVSALPFRAYALIFNEMYRDQDLVDEVPLSLESGPDTTTSLDLLNCAWEKDYFTSARPWTQKGPEVLIPLTGDAPIRGIGLRGTTNWNVTSGDIRETPDVTTTASNTDGNRWTIAGNGEAVFRQEGSGNFPAFYADLSEVTAANVNELRLAMALQRYEEARARWGSRYVEYLRYLRVRSSDARLQLPEYLGGGKRVISWSEVLQTAPTESGDDQVGVGNLKGHGIGAMSSNRYRRFFEEHGYVVTLMSVRPKTIYMQGLARTWNRRVKEDFWQPELQHIGQQEVLNKELYAPHGSPDGVFGYQDRYDEYRRQESRVSGEFRTSELDFWHMARKFDTPPTLNGAFVTANPTKRINAVQSEDVLWCQALHSIQARRQVARTGKACNY